MIEKFQSLEVRGRKSSNHWKFLLCLFPIIGSLAMAQGPGSLTGFFQAWWGFSGIAGLQHLWNPASLNENDLIGTLNADSINFNPDAADGWNMGTDNSKYVLLSTNIVNGINYTVTAWIKPDITAMNLNAVGGWIVADREASGSKMDFDLLYFRGTSPPRFIMQVFNSAGTSEGDANTNFFNNVWQHLAGVVNSSAGTVELFINGISNGSSALTITPNDSYSGRASIGTTAYALANDATKYHGSIGRVRFYNRALSAGEILKEYNQDGTGP
jgi:hypothetical protein